MQWLFGVSWTAVDLRRDVNSCNENLWMIGYGCIVDSGAVNRWSVAGVSDSERVPWAEDHHHTPLIHGNCNVTVFCCQRREVELHYAAHVLSQRTSLFSTTWIQITIKTVLNLYLSQRRSCPEIWEGFSDVQYWLQLIILRFSLLFSSCVRKVIFSSLHTCACQVHWTS